MIQYISMLLKLHPNANIELNHHMSMHVPPFMQLYRPAKLWWCFLYEWLIGQIQHLLSNHKIGQMESTLLLPFLKATKLWQWLSNTQSPPIFQEIKVVFDKIYKSTHSYDDSCGGDSTQTLDISTLKSIPHDLKAMLNVSQRKIYLRAHIKIQDIFYTCSETHLGNSLVHFYLNGDQHKSCVLGQIKYIHSTNGVHYALAIQWQIPLPDNQLDSFTQYLHFLARTYSSTHSLLLEHIDLDWIFCHYTCCDLSPDHSVVLSLSWVCPPIAQQLLFTYSMIGMMSNVC